jgi:hypothetical protein
MDYTCTGLRDGNPITPPYHAPPEINGKDSFGVMRKAIKQRIAPLTEPMQKNHDEFLKSANSSIQLAIECYSEMCKKIGEEYSPSPNSAPLLNIEEAIVPSTVIMPGAIIVRVAE